MRYLLSIALIVVILFSCKPTIKEQTDEVYSRHLQRHVKLSILSTPVPKDKSGLNLLLVNDGQELDHLRFKDVLDSLYKKGTIQPLLVVGIHAGDRLQEYGVSDYPDFQHNGSKAAQYEQFIIKELYPFIKKKAAVRKFHSIAFAGMSLGGLSAFDISWNNADKIDKTGVFSGSFWWRDLDAADSNYSDNNNRIIISKIRSSRKRPHLQYWFYAGGNEEKADRDHDGITDVVDDTKDLAALIRNKQVCPPGDIVYVEDPGGIHDNASWSHWLGSFLGWAFPK